MGARAPGRYGHKAAGVLVFAPSVKTLGEARIFVGAPDGHNRWIYLSPSLESKSQAYVDSVVAHEFAHIVLGHCDRGSTAGAVIPPECKVHNDLPTERDADELISRWGFRKTARPFSVSSVKRRRVNGEEPDHVNGSQGLSIVRNRTFAGRRSPLARGKP